VMGGMPDMGKSSAMAVCIAAAAADPCVDLYLADGMGADLMPWRARARGRRVAVSTDEAVDLLDEVVGRMEASASRLQAEGARKVREPAGQIVVAIDELHAFTTDVSKFPKGHEREGRKKGEVFCELLHLLATLGRKHGIVLLLAVQKPTGNNIPTRIRDVIQYKAAFACATREASVAVLGSGQSLNAHELELRPGMCLLAADGRREPEVCRTFFIDDEMLERLAAQNGRMVRP
jgi:S-DNA-T family DNA segregation ATPase FtsK/SpoIIIE